MFCPRIAAPTSLVDASGKTEIVKSLRTEDRGEANRLVKAEVSVLEEEFQPHQGSASGSGPEWFRDRGPDDLETRQRLDSDEDRKQAREVRDHDPDGQSVREPASILATIETDVVGHGPVPRRARWRRPGRRHRLDL